MKMALIIKQYNFFLLNLVKNQNFSQMQKKLQRKNADFDFYSKMILLKIYWIGLYHLLEWYILLVLNIWIYDFIGHSSIIPEA